ncbi:MAG: glycine--tRNA ligase subunit beta, partial [Planctomycetota bacterium]
SMRWGSPSTSFARPIRRLCALLGDRPIPFEIEGVAARPESAGHPFLAPGAIPVPRADLPAFRESLRKSFVILDPDERKSAIESAIRARLGTGNGARIPSDLLEEVAFLVEWPHLLEGRFDEAFLSVPAIVIEQAMTEHQRYFPVHAPDGRLENRFLVVANRAPADPALIREGNERVLRARLADARYFWETERKTPLESRLPRLEGVLYLQGFGTVRQKADRLAALAKAYADEIPIRANEAEAAVRAALLSKADLVTDLVGEFPKLQGQMGREFLLAEGAANDVAEAVGEHYRPRFAGDAIPSTTPGRIAALADKFDHLVACFAAGFAPTGSQDPMALRRQTIGILRILDEGGLSLPLSFAVERAIDALAIQHHASLAGPTAAAGISGRVLAFLADRVRQHFSDAGFPADHIEAVLASESDEIPDVRARLQALRAISARPEWEALVAAVERTGNITRNEKPVDAVDPDVFEADEERALGSALLQAAEPIQRFFLANKFEAGALLYHVSFTAALQRFFQKVFVNVEDARIRANRLAMLSRIHALFARPFADLSRIVVPGKAAGKGGTDA